MPNPPHSIFRRGKIFGLTENSAKVRVCKRDFFFWLRQNLRFSPLGSQPLKKRRFPEFRKTTPKYLARYCEYVSEKSACGNVLGEFISGVSARVKDQRCHYRPTNPNRKEVRDPNMNHSGIFGLEINATEIKKLIAIRAQQRRQNFISSDANVGAGWRHRHAGIVNRFAAIKLTPSPNTALTSMMRVLPNAYGIHCAALTLRMVGSSQMLRITISVI